MSSSTPAAPSSTSATDDPAPACVALFREAAGLDMSPDGVAMSDATVLAAPLSSFEIDSLTTLEFVMAVEDAFGVELNEAEVNRAATLGDFVAIVRRAKGV